MNRRTLLQGLATLPFGIALKNYCYASPATPGGKSFNLKVYFHGLFAVVLDDPKKDSIHVYVPYVNIPKHEHVYLAGSLADFCNGEQEPQMMKDASYELVLDDYISDGFPSPSKSDSIWISKRDTTETINPIAKNSFCTISLKGTTALKLTNHIKRTDGIDYFIGNAAEENNISLTNLATTFFLTYSSDKPFNGNNTRLLENGKPRWTPPPSGNTDLHFFAQPDHILPDPNLAIKAFKELRKLLVPQKPYLSLYPQTFNPDLPPPLTLDEMNTVPCEELNLGERVIYCDGECNRDAASLKQRVGSSQRIPKKPKLKSNVGGIGSGGELLNCVGVFITS